MKIGGPNWFPAQSCGSVAASKIARRDDEPDVVQADTRGKNEEFLNSRIADGEAARRRGAAVDHDVSAEVC